MTRTPSLTSRARPRAALASVILALALPATATATAASGARVVLACEQAGEPADVRICLTDSRLEISREGEKAAYQATDLATLDDPADGALDLTMPRNFSLKVQNTATDALLTLTVMAPGGATVHTHQAKRFEWVQFYHCGPQVNPTCRDYRTPTN